MIDTQALRNKILDLAMRGQLTEQLPEDGTAEELYQRIRDEKDQLIKEGKLKKEKSLPPVNDEEIPFPIPDNWKWVRLLKITKKITDGTHHSPVNNETGDFMYVTAKNIKENGVDLSNITFVSEDIHQEIYSRCNPEKNDVLLIKDGATTGIVTVNNLEEPFSMLSSVALIKPLSKVVAWYVAYAMRSPWFAKYIRGEMTGVGITRVVLKQIETFLIPLPPLAEQQRIVEKIDKVFSVLDTIDALQAQYVDNLTTLKAKLIDAAIQGKLTKQLPEDGTAEELLARIKDEKQQLMSSGKIPKEKKLPTIKQEEILFDIPSTWEWVRVQDVASYITDYVANGSFATLKAHTKTYKEPNYALFVRTIDFSSNFSEGCSYIDKASYDFLHKSQLFGGELILPNIGASIGKAFIMPDMGMPMSLAPNSILLKFTEPIMNEYFSFVVKSTYGNKLLNKTQGGSATAKFSKTDLRSLVVPLPPLAEIKRIVFTINDVFKTLYL